MAQTAGSSPPYKPAVLRDRKGDLSKEWYIEFYAYNAKKDCLDRSRVKTPTSLTTEKQRRDWARRKIREINALLEKGYHFTTEEKALPIPAKEPSLNEIFDIAIRKAGTLRGKSISGYTGVLEKFRAWLGPDAGKGLEVITRARVSDYIDYLVSQGLGAVTINNQLNITRIMLNKAKKAGFIKENPFVYEKLRETDSYKNVAFSVEHQRAVEGYMKEHNYPLYIFTRLTYYNFIRPGELIQLRIRDFDFERRCVTVPGSVAKSRKTETIPIHPQLYELIRDYREYPSSYYICGKGFVPGKYKAGENAAYEAHKEVLRGLGLMEYEYTLYSWKHVGAVRAYEAGTDLKTLQFLLRHTSIVYTEIYLKSLKLQLRNVELKSW